MKVLRHRRVHVDHLFIEHRRHSYASVDVEEAITIVLYLVSKRRGGIICWTSAVFRLEAFLQTEEFEG